MDAGPLLDYFQKLYNWLKIENMKHNRAVGWDTDIDPCQCLISFQTVTKNCQSYNTFSNKLVYRFRERHQSAVEFEGSHGRSSCEYLYKK